MSTARVYYEDIVREFPNQYYAVTARERLSAMPGRAEPKSKGALEAEAFLKNVNFPQRSRNWNFEASPVATSRIARARLLTSVGMDCWAEVELRYGAEKEDQPQ